MFLKVFGPLSELETSHRKLKIFLVSMFEVLKYGTISLPIIAGKTYKNVE
jgi:hypothetical protein